MTLRSSTLWPHKIRQGLCSVLIVLPISVYTLPLSLSVARNPMPWLKIQLHDISPQSAETYEDALLSLGAQVVTLEDGADEPIFEPELGTTPLWQNSRLTALFSADVDAQLVMLAFTD